MDLLAQLGIFSKKKKKQIIYTVILIIVIAIIIFIWFPQLIPWKLLSTVNNQSGSQEQYQYHQATEYLNVVNNFLENDIPLIKNLNKINTSNQFRLPTSHGRSNPFLP